MDGQFNLHQMFQILLACISPCIWGGSLAVLYPFRRLTSYSWMVFAATGILFLTSAASACLSAAQVTDNFKPQEQMNLVYFWQGLGFVRQLTAVLLVVGIWLSFRDLRDRVDMLTDIVESQGGETPAGNFGRGY